MARSDQYVESFSNSKISRGSASGSSAFIPSKFSMPQAIVGFGDDIKFSQA